jgi:hypothetical protein
MSMMRLAITSAGTEVTELFPPFLPIAMFSPAWFPLAGTLQ